MNLSPRFPGRIGLLVLMGVCAATLAFADDEHRSNSRGFTTRDIKRSYGFSCSGAVVGGPFAGPFAQVGQVSCDGKDICTGTSMASFNGNIIPVSVTGKTTVNPNGTGLVTYTVLELPPPNNVLPIYFVITDGGRGLKGLPLVPGYAVTCDLQEQ